MPNAIDNFQSFYSQYRNAPAAPAQSGMAASVSPNAGNPPAYNPYASTYTPAPNRGTPQPLGTQQPIGAQQQPVNSQPWNNPNYPQQPGYPQPTVPTQPTYPTGYPQQPQTLPGFPQQGIPGYAGPLTSTLGAFSGVVNDKGYDKFVRETAPVIDTAIPLITGIVGLFSKKKPEQPAQAPTTANSVYMPNAQPGYQQPAYQPPVYQQPAYQPPVYQQPGYQQPYPGTPPLNQNGGNNWQTQVNQGIQGVAGLVNALGGLFK